MEASKIGDGLWRWVVPHPDWKPEFDRPDGWGRMVACVYAEYDEAVVLIDPLVPSEPQDAARFWRNLDDDVRRLARPMLILVGCVDHGRSADLVAGRYASMGQQVQVVGDAVIRDKVSCVLHGTFGEVELPAGLQTEAIPGMSPGERAFVLAPWRAAVFSDAVIGTGLGRVRVAPPSWGVKTAEGRGRYDREFRASIRRIAKTGPEVLLPSHGDAVLVNGAAALDEALQSPALGE